MTTLLQLQSLRVKRRDRVICEVESFSIAPLERIAVTGPNGSGKTTLLRVLAGLEDDFEGRLEVGSAQQNIKAPHRVYVHQTPVMFRGTVIHNTMYGLACQGVALSDRKERALKALKQLGIAHLANRTCQNLSGGEQRRIAVARAAIVAPELLLLDEPFADVDDEGRVAICELLDSLETSAVVIASPQAIPLQFTGRQYNL